MDCIYIVTRDYDYEGYTIVFASNSYQKADEFYKKQKATREASGASIYRIKLDYICPPEMLDDIEDLVKTYDKFTNKESFYEV